MCPARALLKRKVFALIAAAFTLAIAAPAFGQADASPQTVTSPHSPTTQAHAVPETPAADAPLEVGRPIYAELTQTIDARKAKPGQKIVAKVTLAVLSRGKVLISDGAMITGHVTEASARSKKDSESVLGIVFDRAELQDGSELPLSLTVQAVGVGALTVPTDLEAASQNPYGSLAGSAMPGPPGPRELPRDPNDPMNAPHPALDVGSTGIVGLKGLDLTEGDTKTGSLVTSASKNVKLDRGFELVLRVIPSKAPSNSSSTPPPSPK